MRKIGMMLVVLLAAIQVFACAAITKKGTQCKRAPSPGSQYCWQHGGTTAAQRAAGLTEADVANVLSYEAPNELFAKVKDSIVLIEGIDNAGTGFIVKMDGATWLMTNEHVIKGSFNARTLGGKTVFTTNKVDIATNRDLIRFKLDDGYQALEWRESPVMMNEKIYVFGNSDGSDVATSLFGRVLGIGDDKFEISAKTIAGNSGSPVLDANGKVLGVATYSEIKRDYREWSKSDTRFNAVRRFAILASGVEWEPLGYKQYIADLDEIGKLALACVALIQLCEYDRSERVSYDDSRYHVVSASKLTKAQIDRFRQNTKLKTILNDIVSADKNYDKAVAKYRAVLNKSQTMQSGDIGKPSKLAIERATKDWKEANIKQIKARDKGLRILLALFDGRKVSSIRGKAKFEEIKSAVEECVAQFEKITAKYVNWENMNRSPKEKDKWSNFR